MMKERFKTRDWERALRLPILMFNFVSLADRQLQKEEVATFVAELHDAAAYKDPLHRELFFDLAQDATFKKAFDYVMGFSSAADIDKEFAGIKKVLNKNLSSEEYNRFFASLTGTGVTIAQSAGDGPSNVSPEEMAALSMFILKFGVDLDAGQAAIRQL
jgi:hypothetical protein